MYRRTTRRLSNLEIGLRIMELLNSGDIAEIEEFLAPDSVEEIPQSGERIRGSRNQIEVMRNYPDRAGSFVAGPARVVAAEPRYVMTPTFNVLQVEGSGDVLTLYAKARYPDDSEWYLVKIITFRDGKIVKQIDFYAPLFEPPEWRRRWVEHMDDEPSGQ